MGMLVLIIVINSIFAVGNYNRHNYKSAMGSSFAAGFAVAFLIYPLLK